MSERASLWVYRALALVVAIGMWYVTVAETRENQSEKTVTASVIYNSKPDNLVMIGQTPEVNVRVTGNSRDIQRLRPWDVDVLVDLSAAQVGNFNVSLDAKNDVLLPDGALEVENVEPNVITLQLDVLEQLMVPVSADLVGEPAAGATVESTKVEPGQVLIEGPRSQLRQITTLLTGPVSLDTHAFDFSEDAPIMVPNAMVRVVRPPLVRVTVSLDQPLVSPPVDNP